MLEHVKHQALHVTRCALHDTHHSDKMHVARHTSHVTCTWQSRNICLTASISPFCAAFYMQQTARLQRTSGV